MRTTKGPDKDVLTYGPIMGPLVSLIRSGYNSVVPSNVRAGVKFALGDTGTIDENFFNEEQHNVIRSAIENAKADGRNYVTYEDYPRDVQDLWHIVNTLGVSDASRALLEGKERPTLLEAMSDPGFNTITTLGQFTFDESDGSYNIHDQFDFNYNDKNLERKASLLGMTVDEYKDKYGNFIGLHNLYNDLRVAHADRAEESMPYDQLWPGLPEEERQRRIQEQKDAARKNVMEYDKYSVIRHGIFPLLEESMGRGPIPIEASISKNMKGGRVVKYNNGGKDPGGLQFDQVGEVSRPPIDERIYEAMLRYLDEAPLAGWHRAEELVDTDNPRFDALRHMLATSETVEELQHDRGYPAPLAMLAANLFGLGHEVKNFHGVRSAAEDLFNNFVGSIPAAVMDDPEKIEEMIKMLSYFTPDGKDASDLEYNNGGKVDPDLMFSGFPGPNLNSDILIDYIVDTRGGDRDMWQNVADMIAYHETGPQQRMDPRARQITEGGGQGPGRGLFQFEDSTASGSFDTAKQRYKNTIDAVRDRGYVLELDPEIMAASNADELTEDQQRAIFYANLIQGPASLRDYAEGNMSLEDLWLKGHKLVEKEGNRGSFRESVSDAQEREEPIEAVTREKGGRVVKYQHGGRHPGDPPFDVITAHKILAGAPGYSDEDRAMAYEIVGDDDPYDSLARIQTDFGDAATEGVMSASDIVSDFMPYLSEGKDLYRTVSGLTEGDYSKAGLGALSLLVPNAIERGFDVLKGAGRRFFNPKYSQQDVEGYLNKFYDGGAKTRPDKAIGHDMHDQNIIGIYKAAPRDLVSYKYGYDPSIRSSLDSETRKILGDDARILTKEFVDGIEDPFQKSIAHRYIGTDDWIVDPAGAVAVLGPERAAEVHSKAISNLNLLPTNKSKRTFNQALGATAGIAGAAGTAEALDLRNNYTAYNNALRRKLGLAPNLPPGSGSESIYMDLSDQKVGYQTNTPGSEYLDFEGQAILGGEFIEGINPNTIRKASDYKNTRGLIMLGDSEHNFDPQEGMYYGVEDDKIVVGGVGKFKDDTEVVPLRFNPKPIDRVTVTEDNTFRMFDSEGSPIYHNIEKMGKMMLYSPSSGESAFFYSNSPDESVEYVNKFIDQHGDALPLVLDNGRYSFYTSGNLGPEDYREYVSQDIERDKPSGYNLYVKENGGRVNRSKMDLMQMLKGGKL